ncbi:MAG: glycosyltransferase family 39 protein [Nostoc sp.]|uniref:ArnT family glycosyltransferase n=1 Tax=Nostoc sp. TaxID=1180 RepID=UPI002FF70104
MIKINWRIISSPYTALGLCLILSSPLFFFRGIGIFDDSVFLKIGELILDGLVPYRDVFDNKPPGIYYLGAAIAAVSNSHWLAPRIFLFIFATVFGAWVIQYTNKYWGRLAAYFVAWIFGISYTIAQGYSFHTDQFCAFFGFAAIVAISGERRYIKKSWLICGIFISLAFLFKQVAVIYLAAIILAQLTATIGKKLSWQSFLNRSIILVSGFIILPVIVVALVIGSGIWHDFYDAVFNSTINFTKKPINLFDTLNLWIKIPSVWLIFPCILISFLDKNLRKLLKNDAYLDELFLLLIVGILSLIPTLHQVSNTHYTEASIVFLAISSSIILSYFWRNLKNKFYSKSIQLFFITILISILLTYTAGLLWGGAVMIKQNRLAIDLTQMNEIRNALNLYLPFEEKILTLSENPARIYYMSGRIPLIKYIYYYGSGWLNSNIPSLEDSAKLVVSGVAPGAIIEIPLAQGIYLNKYKDYQLVELPNSINFIQKTRIFILIRQDFYEHKNNS